MLTNNAYDVVIGSKEVGRCMLAEYRFAQQAAPLRQWRKMQNVLIRVEFRRCC